jgi:ubiquitin carboxyl-terminal hydrolase 36/42
MELLAEETRDLAGMRPGKHEDAHEGLITLLGNITRAASAESTNIQWGYLNKTECKNCGLNSDKDDFIGDNCATVELECRLTDGLVTLQNCVDCHFAPSEVDYRCASGRTLVCDNRIGTASKRLLLTNAPDVLTVVLLRFGAFPGLEKRSTPVLGINSDLVLSDGTRYTCFGVVCHIGGSRIVGHYVAWVRDHGGWWRVDEVGGSGVQHMDSVDTKEVRENAYILFFSKTAVVQPSVFR